MVSTHHKIIKVSPMLKVGWVIAMKIFKPVDTWAQLYWRNNFQ